MNTKWVWLFLAVIVGSVTFCFVSRADAYAPEEYGASFKCHEKWYGSVPVGSCDFLVQRGTVHDEDVWIQNHSWEIGPVIAGLYALACLPVSGPLAVVCAAAGAAEAGIVADRLHVANGKYRCLNVHWPNFGPILGIASFRYPPKGPILVNGMYRYAGDQGCHSPAWWSFPMVWSSIYGPNCWLTAYQSHCNFV